VAYPFVQFPMTLDDIEGHSSNVGLIKCNTTNISVTFSTVLTDTARRAVVPRLLELLVLFKVLTDYHHSRFSTIIFISLARWR